MVEYLRAFPGFAEKLGVQASAVESAYRSAARAAEVGETTTESTAGLATLGSLGKGAQSNLAEALMSIEKAADRMPASAEDWKAVKNATKRIANKIDGESIHDIPGDCLQDPDAVKTLAKIDLETANAVENASQPVTEEFVAKKESEALANELKISKEESEDRVVKLTQCSPKGRGVFSKWFAKWFARAP